MKKITALITVLALLLSLCACGIDPSINDDPENSTKPSAVSDGKLRLAYSKAERLDPFTASSAINLQILGLLYDGLYKLDKSYQPVPVAAKNAIVSGNTVNVTLAETYFSDGTAVTANDVAYSFKLAKSSPACAEKLKNFVSVSISTANMLVFTLLKADPYALACLTFPIVKNGASGEAPVGSGRYVFQKNGEEIYLVVNSKRSGFDPVIKTISLVPIRDNGSVESSLEIGNTGFYYNDLSSGTYSRINAKTVDLGINNFVFLAFNSSSELFSNQLLRQAVNMAIDRNSIASTAFQGHARLCYSPFNPDWYALASKDLVVTRNESKAKELIKQSGIDIASKEISLLVNKDNAFKYEAAAFIRDNLTVLGFKVVFKDYEQDYYTEAVELGSYDLYIGEVRLTPNMDLSPLFGGAVGYGIDPACPSAMRYTQLLEGSCELMDFINTFNEDVPFAPLCYRNGAASYTNSLKGELSGCDSDSFYDIETWSFK